MTRKTTTADGRVKISRPQVFRTARIVALLKKNRMPGAEALLREYEKLEFEDDPPIRTKYSLRTVCRDIDALKNDFRRPHRARSCRGSFPGASAPLAPPEIVNAVRAAAVPEKL